MNCFPRSSKWQVAYETLAYIALQRSPLVISICVCWYTFAWINGSITFTKESNYSGVLSNFNNFIITPNKSN